MVVLAKMTNPFIQQLIDDARQAPKRIVLPEGQDERVLTAAAEATKLGIATCLFLEDRSDLLGRCRSYGIEADERMVSFDPGPRIDHYIEGLIERRRHKGMTAERARALLADPQIVATMMVASGDADGLVSGAVTVTANVLRPALQLIGKLDDEPLVSSFFFMCFESGPRLFADCALNTSPDAEALAAIANQTAETARLFGLDPRVAMLSYSTGSSGSGPSVDLIKAATEALKRLNPALKVEGPIQYDAAVDPRIAQGKMPGSDVAGKANVLIFPDLDAGNIAYKAVQQAAGLISVGPIIQGMKQPINDVSRGATVDDLLYTIATTVIQARTG